MFSTLVVSLVAPFTPHQRTRSAIALAAGAVALIAATATSAHAQTTKEPQPEQKTGWGFHVTEGRLVPTGSQRQVLGRANLTAAQVSYVVHPAFALRSTIGWARSRDLTLGGDVKLDLFTYDIGGEVRGGQWGGSAKRNFIPFVGGGAGARSYNHRDVEIAATHQATAYVSAGGELGIRRVRVRFDVRDYVSGFTSSSRARNDVVVLTSLRLVGR